MSTSPTVPKRQLGMALRRRREELGLDREDAASVLECSPSKIGRIEQGDVGVKATELRALMDLYRIQGDDRRALERLGAETRHRRPRTNYGPALPDWFRRYVNLEEAATRIRTYQPELVPGLLQTEAYARAVMTASTVPAPGDIEHLVQARLARQRRLHGPDAPELWAVISEGTLRQQVGGRSVMREQLAHLRRLADYPSITIQVMPFEAGAHAATGFAFWLLRFPNDNGLETVYLEDLTSATYISDDKPEDQQRYAIAWDHLIRAAATPEASIEIIEKLNAS